MIIYGHRFINTSESKGRRERRIVWKRLLLLEVLKHHDMIALNDTLTISSMHTQEDDIDIRDHVDGSNPFLASIGKTFHH